MSALRLSPGDAVQLDVPRISRTTLALYAGASGDHNPAHVDIDACRAVGIPDVFTHGMLSMAYLGRLLTDWVPQDRIRAYRVRFAAITPVNAEPVCRGVVTAVEDGLAHLELTMSLPDGTVTLKGSAVVATD